MRGQLEGSEGLLKGCEGQQEGSKGHPAGSEGKGDKWTNRISLHSTGLCPLLGPVPKKKQGSLVEWGEILSVQLYIRLCICPSPHAVPQTMLTGPQTLLGGP